MLSTGAFENTKGGPLTRINLPQMGILDFKWAISNLHLRRTISTPQAINEED